MSDSAFIDQVFSEARTAYKFSDKAVSEDLLRELWETTKWAPTSANTQPLRVLFVTSQEGKDRLVPLMNDGNRDRVAGAPAIAIVGWDREFFKHIPHVIPAMSSLETALASNPEMARTMGTYSSALQTGYFILAARALGLVVGPMGGFDKAGVDAEFLSELNWESQLVINLGYETEGSFRDRNPRIASDEVIRFV